MVKLNGTNAQNVCNNVWWVEGLNVIDACV